MKKSPHSLVNLRLNLKDIEALQDAAREQMERSVDELVLSNHENEKEYEAWTAIKMAKLIERMRKVILENFGEENGK